MNHFNISIIFMNTHYTKHPPNKKQRSAIEHPPGSLKILAGAGTGKTFTLEYDHLSHRKL